MSIFKSLSLGKKLAIGFSLIVTVGTASGIYYYHQITKLEVLSEGISQMWLPGIVRSAELKELVASIQASQFQYLVANDDKSRAAADDKLSTAIGSFQIYFKTFSESTSSDEEAELVAEAQKNWDAISAGNDKFVDLIKAKKLVEAQKIISEELQEPFKNLEEGLKKAGEGQYKGGLEASEITGSSFRLTKWFTIASACASALLSLLVSFGIYSWITRSLQNIIGSLKSCATTAQQHSQDLQVTSKSLSANASEAALSISGTASAVEEITSMIEKTSQNALQSQDRSEKSQESVHLGQESASRFTNSMQELDTGIVSVDSGIAELLKALENIAQFMQAINEKTKLTNDIVFQTKLLSFNASVEAARAGEYGKGFSVVAEEVGKLAIMSGNTSKEINDIVTQSTARVKEIATEAKNKFEGLLQKNRQNIEKGNNSVEEFNGVFGQIVKNVGEVATMINEIAEASKEQSKGIREISKTMSQLDQATQENSKSSEEVSMASLSMNEQVENLLNVVHSLEALLKGEGHAKNEEPNPVVAIKSADDKSTTAAS
jgi:methyl-accepting chemotaxis protein